MKNYTLEKLATDIKSIPTLPEVYCQVSEMLENPKTSASAVATVISRDPSLTAKLLKMVNSAFYGLPQQVSTLTHALVLMGFSTLKSLILTMGLTDVFRPSKNDNFSRPEFWAHCFGTGLIAKSIAIRLRRKNVEEIFIQGLLHDIGKIVLDKYVNDAFNKIVELTIKRDCLIVESERDVLGFTHADVGAIVARSWNLPENICQSIEFHHHPANVNNNSVEAGIVHLADIVCRTKMIGDGGDKRVPLLDDKVWTALGINIQVLTGIMAEASACENSIDFFSGK